MLTKEVWKSGLIMATWNVRTMLIRKMIGRRKGRPRLRWMDDDLADLKVTNMMQWMGKTKDREQWRLVVGEAKARPGLERREDVWTDITYTRFNERNTRTVLYICFMGFH
jgi:hypothetical protein